MVGRPFRGLSVLDPEPGYVNVDGTALGFYHFGEKFTWDGGGDGVRNGYNQSVAWGGHVMKYQPAKMWAEWFGTSRIGFNTTAGRHW